MAAVRARSWPVASSNQTSNAGCSPAARAEEILRLDGFDSGEDLRQEAFVLRRAATLQVDCEGAGGGGREEMYAYGWILDARTREVVWALSPERSRAKDGERMTFSGSVSAVSS